MRKLLKTAAVASIMLGLGVSAAAACWWGDDTRRSSRVYGYGPTYGSYYGYNRGYYGYGPAVSIGFGYDGWRGRHHRHYRYWR
jgi:hypothetical protein